MANPLQFQSSPYLLQHANNPVNWYAWNQESLNKAKNEDKPIILSIGYSACHWCHVMEHESFENHTIASIMNDNFICIKVDREERPDVDAYYMDALQAMGLQGGWPLNVFLTPTKKPFYGGTYFNANKWTQICQSVAEAFENKREKIEESAESFVESLNTSISRKYGLTDSKSVNYEAIIIQNIDQIIGNIDPYWGGLDHAPKFPLPVIWSYLLECLQHPKLANKQSEIKVVVENTLTKMAIGGIFDHVGGGFARYSVDGQWFVPHFEKMLYDNAQLLGLYAKGFLYTKNPLFKEVMEQTADFLLEELQSENGFYAALDADSEGEEGKYYCWEMGELQHFLGNSANQFLTAYNIKNTGNWEGNKNILFKAKGFLNEDYKIELSQLKLARKNRIKPGLDNKIITAWNSQVVTGLLKVYKATSNDRYFQIAVETMNSIWKSKFQNGRLNRIFNYKNNIEGFLEDYSLTIEALLDLYKTDFNEDWLAKTETLLELVLEGFWDSKEGYFANSNVHSNELLGLKHELFDSVMPSGNAVMAHNLFELGVILSKQELTDMSYSMAHKMKTMVEKNAEYTSVWASLFLKMMEVKTEVVVTGPNCFEFAKELKEKLPNFIFTLAAETQSSLPIFENRFILGQNRIFICINQVCNLPYNDVDSALKFLNV